MAEQFFGWSDVGRQRDNNEDAFLVQATEKNTVIAACVIDGVGGYEGGEVAASLARQTILESLERKFPDRVTMMQQAFAEAHRRIVAEKQSDSRLQQMACVLTMALIDIHNNQLVYAHVGDTRLYLLRDQNLIKLTKDHSFVGLLEDSGRLNEAEAMAHPKRNEVDKALGFSYEALPGDYIETGTSPFLPGDLALLCSDGLSDLVSSAQMVRVLTSAGTLEEKAKQLVDAANAAGGKDNITVVLVQNSKKPVKQKALKPMQQATVPASEQPAAAPEESLPKKPPRTKPLSQDKRNRAAVISLAVLCLVLMGGLIYLTWKQYKYGEKTEPVVVAKNNQESTLQALINQTHSDTLLLADTIGNGTITLTDTIFIDRDSLYLKGNLVIKKDSLYSTGGPAFAISPNCKWIVIDGLQFRDFNTALLIGNKNTVELKNTRFINCVISLAYAGGADDFIHGTFVNTRMKPNAKQ